MGNNLLQTARLGLRRWKPSDLEPFARMNRDEQVMHYFPQRLTPDESAVFVKRIDAFFDENGYGLYAVELLSAGAFIGFVGFSRPSFESWFTPCVEIGWRLRKEVWGCGYATEAAKECLRHGFEDLGLDRVVSFTAAVNAPSERVMQKIGMRKLGEFEHPRIEEESWLRRHVLYESRINSR